MILSFYMARFTFILCLSVFVCACVIIRLSGSQGAGVPEVMACKASLVAQLLLNPADEEIRDEEQKDYSLTYPFFLILFVI